MGKRWQKFCIGLGSCALSLGLSILPSSGAERLILQIGPLEQRLSLKELENFASTGELSPELRPYQSLLNEQVQTLLQQELEADNNLAQQFVEDLFNSGDGEKLLAQLQTLIPGSSRPELLKALRDFLASQKPITLLNILQSYPQENLTIDLVALGSWLANRQIAQVEKEVLSASLAKDLAVVVPPSQPGGFSPTELGSEVVYREMRVFEDKERERTITADLYQPARPQGQMVVLSHGFAADRHFLKYLAYHLASHGITVVALEHPGSNIYALVDLARGQQVKPILPPEEFIERPRDISFVLDELAKIHRSPGYGQGKFPTQQVTVIGHSFGGYTALALAGAQLNPKALRHSCEKSLPLDRYPADWLQCAASELPYARLSLRDRRIVGAVVLNPIIGDLFAQNLDSVQVPVLMLSSSHDGITPIVAHQLRSFEQLPKEKYLLVAIGATHLSVTDISYLRSAMGQSTLVREVMDERAEPVRRLICATSLAFLKQQTPSAAEYQAYLSPEYVQSLSGEEVGLRLTTQLPQETRAWLNLLTPDSSTSLEQWDSLVARQVQLFDQIFAPLARPQQKTKYLEPIFGSLLEQYYQEIQGLS